MRIFTVHLRRHGLDPDRDLVLVKEGFSWPAFFLTGMWALWHRLWLAAVALFAVSIGLNLVSRGLGADPASHAVVSVAFAAIVGFVANDLRRQKLAASGFAAAGVAAGSNREEALGRYLESEPELAQDLAQGLSR